MKTIENKVKNELIINKSKFITIIEPITDIKNVEEVLKNYQNIFNDATHICYAYILDSKKKMSDDKEPSGTAGLPILSVLEKNDLTNVLAVVIRYFSGIKLGSRGLIRAYSNSVKEALKITSLIEYVLYKELTINFSYEEEKQINYLLDENIKIINKAYLTAIIYSLLIPENIYDNSVKILNSYIEK